MSLLISVIVILILSLLSLTAISPQYGISQSIFIIPAALAGLFFAKMPYGLHKFLIKIYAVSSLILLILPILFGEITRGAVRWLQIGSLTLQPSEIIKPFLIIIFSYYLSTKNKKLWQYFLLLLVPAVLIFKQPDLGSALVIMAIWLGILFASKISMKLLLFLFLIAGLVSPLVWYQLKPYQQQRLTSFINPYADPKISGYHVIQSVISIGSGGFFGLGLGRGTQSQLQFLPERQTDFIFASLAEELGFIGAIILLTAYFFLLKRLLEIILKAPDEFGRLIATGVFSLIFFQTVVNIGMNLGLLPITGITLPLVSSGGSSLLTVFICLGLVYNINFASRENKPLEIK